MHLLPLTTLPTSKTHLCGSLNTELSDTNYVVFTIIRYIFSNIDQRISEYIFLLKLLSLLNSYFYVVYYEQWRWLLFWFRLTSVVVSGTVVQHHWDLFTVLGLFRTSLQHPALVSYWHLHISISHITHTTISNDFAPFLGVLREGWNFRAGRRFTTVLF